MQYFEASIKLERGDMDSLVSDLAAVQALLNERRAARVGRARRTHYSGGSIMPKKRTKKNEQAAVEKLARSAGEEKAKPSRKNLPKPKRAVKRLSSLRHPNRRRSPRS